MRLLRSGLLVLIGVLATVPLQAQPPLAAKLRRDMRKAAEFYHGQVATHGGYVYHYLLDLSRRWGEGEATRDQIWVQPPGTPTVGLAYLQAWTATGDEFYLRAATDAAEALCYGQLESGGFRNAIDFDPHGTQVARYRGGGKGRNHSSLDDGQTQSAIELLVAVDRAHRFQHTKVHEAASYALEALLDAQFPNGGFPQVWTGPVEARPVLSASFPEYDWRTEGRIKNYWDMYTINDNVPAHVADTLIEAYRTYDDQRYLEALQHLGDFLVLAQLPEPQRAWAQQYNEQMKPIWARRFEPPAVAGAESKEVIKTLLQIAHVTGEKKYLEPIEPALQWMQRSMLPDGQLARYYELRTNRPLYMNRTADRYELTYDDSELPDHYGWKSEVDVDALRRRYQRVKAGKPPELPPSPRKVLAAAQKALQTLDSQGRWVSQSEGEQLIGDLKLPVGTPYLSSRVFSENLTALAKAYQQLEQSRR